MLQLRRHWIFDLDGTLTVSAHDFEHMRRELGLAPEEPILEALHAMPQAQAAPLWEVLNELEFFYAGKASLMQGATELLQMLHENGRQLAILTRNTIAMPAFPSHPPMASCNCSISGRPTPAIP